MKISRRQLIQAGAIGSVALLAPQVAKAQPTGLVHVDQNLERFTTGFQQLDQALGGGLRRGGLYLFLGAFGTGKTLLTKYIQHSNGIEPWTRNVSIRVTELDEYLPVSVNSRPITGQRRYELLCSLKKLAIEQNLVILATMTCNREPVFFGGVAHEVRPHSAYFIADAVFATSKDHTGVKTLNMTKNRYGERVLDGPKFRIHSSHIGLHYRQIAWSEKVGRMLNYFKDFPV